jgi:F0F1-type ATP synthase assembly protein I
MQKIFRESGPEAAASYSLIGAVLLLGGLGYLLDKYLNTRPWLLLAGLFLGIAVGFYELIKVVFGSTKK